MDECVDVAHRAGAEIWSRFGVPVYFYESAAKIPERRRLENVRRKGFDGGPPDIGDIPAHPTAGAAIVGARGLLIAFNINLATENAAVAAAIARKIRESSGGFPFVKAMGRHLASRRCAQVSMNLTNFENTPLDRVYDADRRRGSASGYSCGVEPAHRIRAAPRVRNGAGIFSPRRKFRRIAHHRISNRYNRSECW